MRVRNMLPLSVEMVPMRLSYWVRPYDAVLDARRWRWQPRGKCQYQARLSLAECEAWLREQLGEDEWSRLTTGQIAAMTNTLYQKQPSGNAPSQSAD